MDFWLISGKSRKSRKCISGWRCKYYQNMGWGCRHERILGTKYLHIFAYSRRNENFLFLWCVVLRKHLQNEDFLNLESKIFYLKERERERAGEKERNKGRKGQCIIRLASFFSSFNLLCGFYEYMVKIHKKKKKTHTPIFSSRYTKQ